MIVFSMVSTSERSTGVLFCNPVRISCGFGWGSFQKGALSLLSSVRKARTCGSRCASDAGFVAAEAGWFISVVPAIRVANFRTGFIDGFLGWGDRRLADDDDGRDDAYRGVHVSRSTV